MNIKAVIIDDEPHNIENLQGMLTKWCNGLTITGAAGNAQSGIELIRSTLPDLVFLDIQVGFSTVQTELPLLEKYLSMPNVHFGIDPEFSMKEGGVPGKRIGTFDAEDINYVTGYLSDLVKKNNLPPKIFVIHRFTKRMVTNYQAIRLRNEIQVVMDMDGWGSPKSKKGTYQYFIAQEPVQFTRFKLFYKNDLKNAPYRMLTAKEILDLKPSPIYIQYQ